MQYECRISAYDKVEASAYTMMGTGEKVVSITMHPDEQVVALSLLDAIAFASEIVRIALDTAKVDA